MTAVEEMTMAEPAEERTTEEPAEQETSGVSAEMEIPGVPVQEKNFIEEPEEIETKMVWLAE